MSDDMDRQAYEKIMEWHITPTNFADLDGNLIYNLFQKGGGEPIMPLHDWHPTTDIGQAMQVAAVMVFEGYHFISDHEPGRRPRVKFYKPETGSTGIAAANALSEAIVKAALQAVNVENSEGVG